MRIQKISIALALAFIGAEAANYDILGRVVKQTASVSIDKTKKVKQAQIITEASNNESAVMTPAAPLAYSIFQPAEVTYDNAPADLALYSRGEIVMRAGRCIYMINDGSSIKCKIASESTVDQFSIQLSGSNNEISELHTKGGVKVYSGATVTNAYFYNDDPYIYTRDGVIVNDPIPMFVNSWPYAVNTSWDNNAHGSSNKTVNAGSTYHLYPSSNVQNLTVNSNATLIIHPGTHRIRTLDLKEGSKVKFSSVNTYTELNVINSFNWRASILTSYPGMRSLVKKFKVIFHGTNPVNIEGDWAGTMFAPNAYLTVGKANKTSYGRFVGNGITVRDNARIIAYRVNP